VRATRVVISRARSLHRTSVQYVVGWRGTTAPVGELKSVVVGSVQHVGVGFSTGVCGKPYWAVRLINKSRNLSSLAYISLPHVFCPVFCTSWACSCSQLFSATVADNIAIIKYYTYFIAIGLFT